MRYLNTYNERVDYLDRYNQMQMDIIKMKGEYTKNIENCILYLTDSSEDYEVGLADHDSDTTYDVWVHYNDTYMSNELYDDIDRTIAKLKDELKAEDFIIAITVASGKREEGASARFYTREFFSGKNCWLLGWSNSKNTKYSKEVRYDIKDIEDEIKEIHINFK